MKKICLMFIVCLTSLMLPILCYSVDKIKDKKVFGVIGEKTEAGDYIEVGDYSISKIGKVTIKETGKADKTGSPKDFFTGALVIVDLGMQFESGHWSAPTIAILVGGNHDRALASLSKDEKYFLKKTQESMTEENIETADSGEKPKTNWQKNDNLRIENGVWVN